jgi:hypothetical protein
MIWLGRKVGYPALRRSGQGRLSRRPNGLNRQRHADHIDGNSVLAGDWRADNPPCRRLILGRVADLANIFRGHSSGNDLGVQDIAGIIGRIRRANLVRSEGVKPFRFGGVHENALPGEIVASHGDGRRIQNNLKHCLARLGAPEVLRASEAQKLIGERMAALPENSAQHREYRCGHAGKRRHQLHHAFFTTPLLAEIVLSAPRLKTPQLKTPPLDSRLLDPSINGARLRSRKKEW